jgi:hypothetical protein
MINYYQLSLSIAKLLFNRSAHSAGPLVDGVCWGVGWMLGRGIGWMNGRVDAAN